MRVFRPGYTKNGKRHKAGFYHAAFKDHNGIWRQLPTGITDRVAAEAFGRRLHKLVDLRVAGAALDVDTIVWAENRTPDVRDRLLGWGLVGDSARALAEPLEDHVNDYRDHLLAKNDTPDHARSQRRNILRMFKACGFEYWRDVNAGAVEKWLAEQRAASMSCRTSNGYLGAVKSFCTWMRDDGRTGTEPLRRLEAVPVTDERQRGAFTVQQVQAIDCTAKSTRRRSRLDGPTRALLYRLAVETGLRAGALSALTRDSIRFDDDGSGVVTVGAGHQKNRRRHSVPIRASLGAELRPLIARTPAGRALFPLKRSRGAEIIKADLRDAGLPERDAEGHGLDFHAMRHTTGTWLSAVGVDLKVIQAILGHRTFAMTADRYTHAQVDRVKAELAKLPELRATGTDGASACAWLARDTAETGRACQQMNADGTAGAIVNAVSDALPGFQGNFESGASADSATPAILYPSSR